MKSDNSINGIFEATRNSLYRVVSRLVPPKEIEDIVQETYVKVCQYAKKEEILHPKAFLLKTARNLSIDYLSNSEVRLVDSSDDKPDLIDQEDEIDSIYQQVVSDQEFGQFCESVRLLPVQCRKVFVLKKVYGYSQREIAKKIGISQSTVEKHVALGIQRCTFFMMEQEESQKQSQDTNYSAKNSSVREPK